MSIGIIPARWASSRFPGKPLADILGKSLIRRTYDKASQCQKLDALVVATDDPRIASHVESFGGRVVMTSVECPTGTDRTCEAISNYFPEAEIVVNIQGDEPCLNPQIIDLLIEKLKNTPGAMLTTPVAKINNIKDLHAPSVVKCVFDCHGKALYFSRAPIPFPKNDNERYDAYRHLGIYCFRRDFLFQYVRLEPSRLQQIEDLEQLKVLQAGFPIHVCEVEDVAIGVDIPDDIKRVEAVLCNQENTSLSQAELSLL